MVVHLQQLLNIYQSSFNFRWRYYNIKVPQFLIDGTLKSFESYKEDVAQLYLDQFYPHCRKCLKWGTTTANCSDCRVKLNKKRDKLQKECTKKKMSIKQIRSLVGKVKLDAICIRCSKEAHTYNKCSNKPHCKHDGLTHSAGDRQRCEVYKSIRQCLKNALIMHQNQINPLSLSLWQIADYMGGDPAPSPKVPTDLQIQIPAPKTNDTTNPPKPTNKTQKPTANPTQTNRTNLSISDNNDQPPIDKILYDFNDEDEDDIDDEMVLTPDLSESITKHLKQLQSTNTNNSTNTPHRQSMDNNAQSEEDVDMSRPSRKQRKPQPTTNDDSRSRSRSRRPRSKSKMNNKRNRNKK